MTELFINGQKADIDHKNWTAFHGKNVFTTLCTKNGLPFLWSRHWARLSQHAAYFGYTMPLEEDILRLIEKAMCHKRELKIRLIISDTNYALLYEPLIPYPKDIYEGVTIITSRFMTHPQLGFLKTGNYLPYALALKEAQQQHAFEALMMDHQGFVVDGSRTSIMMYDGFTLWSLEGGISGSMREEILDYATRQKVSVVRKKLKANELTGQLLLSNSLMGLVPVGPSKYQFINHLIDKFRPN